MSGDASFWAPRFHPLPRPVCTDSRSEHQRGADRKLSSACDGRRGPLMTYLRCQEGKKEKETFPEDTPLQERQKIYN